jgi:hypothetical protein
VAHVGDLADLERTVIGSTRMDSVMITIMKLVKMVIKHLDQEWVSTKAIDQWDNYSLKLMKQD